MTSTACATRGRWSPLTVIAMIGGFAIWWPIGLAVLAWIIWGDRFDRRSARDAFQRMKGEFGGFARSNTAWSPSTGNSAFDTYKAETLRRLDEERRRIDEEARAFSEFMTNLRRARDQEEFDRFMADRRRNQGQADA
jgi:hypothetical protein